MYLAKNIIYFISGLRVVLFSKDIPFHPAIIWNFIERCLYVMVRYSNMTENIILQ